MEADVVISIRPKWWEQILNGWGGRVWQTRMGVPEKIIWPEDAG